jgi:hypothetical protein
MKVLHHFLAASAVLWFEPAQAYVVTKLLNTPTTRLQPMPVMRANTCIRMADEEVVDEAEVQRLLEEIRLRGDFDDDVAAVTESMAAAAPPTPARPPPPPPPRPPPPPPPKVAAPPLPIGLDAEEMYIDEGASTGFKMPEISLPSFSMPSFSVPSFENPFQKAVPAPRPALRIMPLPPPKPLGGFPPAP